MAFFNLNFQPKPFIHGQWVNTTTSFVVQNPANDDTLAVVMDAQILEVEAAIRAAQQTFFSWRETTAQHRAVILLRWSALLLQHQAELAQLLSAEQGKSLVEADAELSYARSFIDWFAAQAQRLDGHIMPSLQQDRQLLTFYKPVGVVAAITPWNFPAAMVTRKLAPALAAGCTVVLKPSEFTPLTALALAALAQQAGLPDGVLNVIPTINAEATGRYLCQSALVRKITFTGSTQVGQWLMQHSAGQLQRLSLELGGNAPALVYSDADIGQALTAIMHAKFRNFGQACIAVNRVLVAATILPTVLAGFTQRIAQLHSSQPLIHVKAAQRVHALVQDAIVKGARLEYGGLAAAPETAFYPPTLLSGVTPEMAIWQQEIFGPVLTVTAVDDESLLVPLANAVPAGLAAYAFTQSVKRSWQLMQQLDVGMLGLNEAAISNEVIPFGGIKASGFGREGSQRGLDDYVAACHVHWRTNID